MTDDDKQRDKVDTSSDPEPFAVPDFHPMRGGDVVWADESETDPDPAA